MAFSLKYWICRRCSRFDTSRTQLVAEMMDSREGIWLDAGCGDGDLFELRKDFSGLGVGIELDFQSLHAAKARGLPNRSYMSVDLEHRLPFRTSSLDVVTSCGVLNYVDRVPELIEEVHRVLKPWGWFLFEVPNFAAFYRRWDALLGRIPATSGYTTFRGGVKTQFTARMIEQELIGGFNRKLGDNRGFDIRGRRTAGIFSRIRDVVWPSLSGSEFCYVLQKRGN
jgi:SAM-dependent methyltransferase